MTDQLTEVNRQLQQAKADVAEKDQLLDDIKHSLKCSQDELRNRNREVEELDQALKERQWELHHRAAQVGCCLFTCFLVPGFIHAVMLMQNMFFLQVTQLDMTIKEHKSEMEQRCIQMEGALKKNQFELQQKSKQVGRAVVCCIVSSQSKQKGGGKK